MKGTMNIELIGESINAPVTHSGISAGVLKLPEGVEVDGELLAVGENDQYLHCFITGTGSYYGIFKSEDENHIYQHLLELNT